VKPPTSPKPCFIDRCTNPAGYAFLAGGGEQWDRVTLPDGRRLRACRGHLFTTVDRLTATFAQLPGGGPARIRAVPLGVPHG